MAANPALTVGTGKGNAIITPQPGMLVQPVVLVDSSGNIASVNPNPSGQLLVGNGSVTAGTTLSAVTANTTGTTVDAGVAQSNWSAIAVAGGSPTSGTLTLELSLDGTSTSWVSSGSTNSIIAAGNYLVVSTGRTARYARVSLTNLSGSITLTVKMMAAG